MIDKENAQHIRDVALKLRSHYNACHLCPWDCGVNRHEGRFGPCRTGAFANLSAAAVHHGEEPPVSGKMGTGNLFFSGCTMACVYCQNYQISQVVTREATPPEAIGQRVAELAKQGVHNIGLVSAAHVLPDAIMGLYHAAVAGVNLPVVYNTNSFEQPEVLRDLEGIIDVYLADLRYSDPDEARRYSRTRSYVAHARQAILEMARQVGPKLETDSSGIAVRGLIVRILVLPNDIAGVSDSLEWLKSAFGTRVTISLMAQYIPMYKAKDVVLLSRPLHHGEYLRALDLAERMGFTDIFVQSMDAGQNYIPDFRDGRVKFSGK